MVSSPVPVVEVYRGVSATSTSPLQQVPPPSSSSSSSSSFVYASSFDISSIAQTVKPIPHAVQKKWTSTTQHEELDDDAKRILKTNKIELKLQNAQKNRHKHLHTITTKACTQGRRAAQIKTRRIEKYANKHRKCTARLQRAEERRLQKLAEVAQKAASTSPDAESVVLQKKMLDGAAAKEKKMALHERMLAADKRRAVVMEQKTKKNKKTQAALVIQKAWRAQRSNTFTCAWKRLRGAGSLVADEQAVEFDALARNLQNPSVLRDARVVIRRSTQRVVARLPPAARPAARLERRCAAGCPGRVALAAVMAACHPDTMPEPTLVPLARTLAHALVSGELNAIDAAWMRWTAAFAAWRARDAPRLGAELRQMAARLARSAARAAAGARVAEEDAQMIETAADDDVALLRAAVRAVQGPRAAVELEEEVEAARHAGATEAAERRERAERREASTTSWLEAAEVWRVEEQLEMMEVVEAPSVVQMRSGRGRATPAPDARLPPAPTREAEARAGIALLWLAAPTSQQQQLEEQSLPHLLTAAEVRRVAAAAELMRRTALAAAAALAHSAVGGRDAEGAARRALAVLGGGGDEDAIALAATPPDGDEAVTTRTMRAVAARPALTRGVVRACAARLRGASATAELRRVAGTAAPALEEPVDGAAAILMSAAHVLARLHPTFFQE